MSLETNVCIGSLGKQNYRISWVGRDPQGSLSPTPDSTQGILNLNYISKSILRMLLEHRQSWGHDHLLGNLFQCLATRLVKNFSLISNRTLISQLISLMILSGQAFGNTSVSKSAQRVYKWGGSSATPWITICRDFILLCRKLKAYFGLVLCECWVTETRSTVSAQCFSRDYKSRGNKRYWIPFKLRMVRLRGFLEATQSSYRS